MSTNYFWFDRPCEHCGRITEVHVGKQTSSFIFRVYPHDPTNGLVSPLGVDVMSRADWALIFANHDGYLQDEYGVIIPNAHGWVQ